MADMTVLAVQKLQPAETYKKYNVSPGLFVGVTSTGEKTFIVRYSVGGKQIEYRLPKPFGLKSDGGHISLLDARAKAAEIKALGKQGINYEQRLQAEAEAAKTKAALQDAGFLGYASRHPAPQKADKRMLDTLIDRTPLTSRQHRLVIEGDSANLVHAPVKLFAH